MRTCFFRNFLLSAICFFSIINPTGSGLAQSSDPKLSEVQAARFLAQATMGYNLGQVERLREIGIQAWLIEQVNEEPTLTEPYIEYLKSRFVKDEKIPREKFAYHKIDSRITNASYRNMTTAWLRSVLSGDDHLRKRTAWALSQILVVANKSNAKTEGMANYYDLLLKNAFGNYEDLLLDVTLHPMMGSYLTYLGNKKANPNLNRFPDENYAREIMQLFTIGLWELNSNGTKKTNSDGKPIPSYSNTDIKVLARVFTGLWPQGDRPQKIKWDAYDQPMKMFDQFHDKNAKYALNGLLELRSGLPPMEDIRRTVKVLARHPNTAPFISKKLISQMVTSNPSTQYVERIVRVWNQTSGNLGKVISAILLDREARERKYFLDKHYGRLKGPVLRLTNLLIAYKCGQELGMTSSDYPGLQWWHPDPSKYLQQAPTHSPTVFNFFDASYSKPGTIADAGLKSPEFEILNDVTAASVPNYLLEGLTNGFHQPRLVTHYFKPNANTPGAELRCELGVADPSRTRKLIEDANVLLSAGLMSGRSRNKIDLLVSKVKNQTEKAKMIVLLTAVSSASAIQK